MGPYGVDDGIHRQGSTHRDHRPAARTSRTSAAHRTGIGHDDGQIVCVQGNAADGGRHRAAQGTVVGDKSFGGVDHRIDRTGGGARTHQASPGAAGPATGTGNGQGPDHRILVGIQKDIAGNGHRGPLNVAAHRIGDGIDGKRSPEGPHRTAARTAGTGAADRPGIGDDQGQIRGIQNQPPGCGADGASPRALVGHECFHPVHHGVDRTGSGPRTHQTAARTPGPSAGTGQGQGPDDGIFRAFDDDALFGRHLGSGNPGRKAVGHRVDGRRGPEGPHRAAAGAPGAAAADRPGIGHDQGEILGQYFDGTVSGGDVAVIGDGGFHVIDHRINRTGSGGTAHDATSAAAGAAAGTGNGQRPDHGVGIAGQGHQPRGFGKAVGAGLGGGVDIDIGDAVQGTGTGGGQADVVRIVHHHVIHLAVSETGNIVVAAIVVEDRIAAGQSVVRTKMNAAADIFREQRFGQLMVARRQGPVDVDIGVSLEGQGAGGCKAHGIRVVHHGIVDHAVHQPHILFAAVFVDHRITGFEAVVG